MEHQCHGITRDVNHKKSKIVKDKGESEGGDTKNSKQETGLYTFIDALKRKRERARANARTSKNRGSVASWPKGSRATGLGQH